MWQVMLCGGRGKWEHNGITWAPIVKVDYLAPVLERPVDLRKAGIYVERYRVDAIGTPGRADEYCASAVYEGLARCLPLATKFDPRRLPL